MDPNTQNYGNQPAGPANGQAMPFGATNPPQQPAYPPQYNAQPPQPGQAPPNIISPQQGQPPQGQASPPPAQSNPNSTQNSLQIAEIRDGIVIMQDGTFRSVIMLKSINFDLMSPEEREGVESGYQSFLNSLTFPVQIYVHSQKVDIRPYLNKLDKIRKEHDNMLLSLLMEDYLGFIEDLSLQTNIMDKKFYMVIPYQPNITAAKAITQSKNFFTGLTGMFKNEEKKVVINENDLNKAKDELRNRIQTVLAGLQQSGVPGLPLDTQELIELYYDAYNPDTATRQPLKNFNQLNAAVITKGEGNANQPNLNKELK